MYFLFIQEDSNGFPCVGFSQAESYHQVSFARPLLQMIPEALLQLETAPTISLVP